MVGIGFRMVGTHRVLGRGARGLFGVIVGALATLPAGAIAQDEVPAVSGPPTEVSVSSRGTVRLHAADIPLSTVLHLLSLEGRRNIIASPNVTGTVTANLYDATFEEALEAVLLANGAGYRKVGSFIYVYTKDELKDLEKADAPGPVTRVYRLNYVSAEDMVTYLRPIVGEDGAVASPSVVSSGLASQPEEGGGNSHAGQEFVVVTAPPTVHVEAKKIIRQIDVRPRQVLVEARILRAELSEENALGIDFTLVGGVDLELLGASSNAIQDLTLGQLPQARFELFNASVSTDLSSNVPTGGLSVGILKDHVALFIRALEGITDITVLANPKMLALNRQKAQVIVGHREPFLTTTVTETAAVQTVEFQETGTQLIFRPFIGDDGYIRVELHPEDSSGNLNALNLPAEDTTELTTNVLIRDGETILIGGMFRETTTDRRAQVPGLGSLPGIGALFRSKTDSTSREEIIILLTVHIVKDRRDYAEASREQLEHMERIRVGARQGLMWHGRERLAQARYHKALRALADGDKDKALWHLNLALYNLPRMMPAVQLKERLLGERAWDDDGTGGRSFLHSVITRSKGYAIPPFGRPAPTIEPSPHSTIDGPVEDEPSDR